MRDREREREREKEKEREREMKTKGFFRNTIKLEGENHLFSNN